METLATRDLQIALVQGIFRSRARAEAFVDGLKSDVGAQELLTLAKQFLKETKAKTQTDTLVGVATTENKRELIYAIRSLAFCGIPYDEPKDSSGNLLREVAREIRTVSGVLTVTHSSKKVGVSVVFGPNDRRFFAWMCTQAIKQQSNKIILPDNFSAVLKEIGWSGKHGYDHWNNSFQRWRHNTIEMELTPFVGGKPVPVSMGGQTGVIKSWHLPRHADIQAGEGSPFYLELSLDFYEALKNEPFPIPLEYLSPFVEQPQAWDFAVFLAARVAACQTETRIPLYAHKNARVNVLTLKAQLGVQDSNSARWVQRLDKYLTAIKKYWVDLDAEIVGSALIIRPTPYMVPYTGSRGFLSAFVEPAKNDTPTLFPATDYE